MHFVMLFGWRCSQFHHLLSSLEAHIYTGLCCGTWLLDCCTTDNVWHTPLLFNGSFGIWIQAFRFLWPLNWATCSGLTFFWTRWVIIVLHCDWSCTLQAQHIQLFVMNFPRVTGWFLYHAALSLVTEFATDNQVCMLTVAFSQYTFWR